MKALGSLIAVTLAHTQTHTQTHRHTHTHTHTHPLVCIIVKCAVVTATTGITLSEDRLQTEHTEHMSVNDPNSYSY